LSCILVVNPPKGYGGLTSWPSLSLNKIGHFSKVSKKARRFRHSVDKGIS
jgi:hypothetical protein